MSPVTGGLASSAAENGTAALRSQPYDHQGAMLFVVAVCCVYALALFFMIASHVRRRSAKRELDRAISLYLHTHEDVRAKEELQRLQSMKRAVRPLIDLTRRNVGQQASLSGQQRLFRAEIDRFGCPTSFSEKLHITEVERRRTLPEPLLFGDGGVLPENDKIVQCQLAASADNRQANSFIAEAEVYDLMESNLPHLQTAGRNLDLPIVSSLLIREQHLLRPKEVAN